MKEGLVLGVNVDFPKKYAPELLTPVPRFIAQEKLGIFESERMFVGYDEWTLFEFVWLDLLGSPQVRVGKLSIPATTPNIVESKSLKLYLNSLFYKEFGSAAEVIECVQNDLGKVVAGDVSLKLLTVDQRFSGQQENDYKSLDDKQVSIAEQVDSHLLKILEGGVTEQRYVTHRFRSLCPVTNQPDWASVFIRLNSKPIDQASLARYLLSYSEHNGFHENCVESIYLDLNKVLVPLELCVTARFTRRGGVDINPVRASSSAFLDSISRTYRQ